MKRLLYLLVLFLSITCITSCGDNGGSSGRRAISPVGPEGGIALDYSGLQIHKIGITQSLSSNEVSLYVDIENTGFQNLTSMVARFIGEPFWDNEFFDLAAKERKIVTTFYGRNHSDIPTSPSILKVYILRFSNLNTMHPLAYKDGSIYYEAVP